MSLFQIPDVLFAELCSYWVELKDVAQLDSSMTNKENRENFLNILKRDVSSSFDDLIRHSLLVWLGFRHIRLFSLFVECTCGNEIQTDLFSGIDCSKVKSINIHDSFNLETAKYLVNLCSNLQVLDASNNKIGFGSKLCEEISPKVLKQLTEIKYVIGENCEYLSKHCTHLETLTIKGRYLAEKTHGKHFLKLVEKNPKIRSIFISQDIVVTFYAKILKVAPNLTFFDGFFELEISEMKKVVAFHKDLNSCVLIFFESSRFSLSSHTTL
jgi:hypothetical protein